MQTYVRLLLGLKYLQFMFTVFGSLFIVAIAMAARLLPYEYTGQLCRYSPTPKNFRESNS